MMLNSWRHAVSIAASTPILFSTGADVMTPAPRLSTVTMLQHIMSSTHRSPHAHDVESFISGLRAAAELVGNYDETHHAMLIAKHLNEMADDLAREQQGPQLRAVNQ